MTLIRALARPLLASTFVYGGAETLRNPAPRVPGAQKVLGSLPEQLPVAASAEQLVRADAAAKVVAGSLLAVGRLPRISALVLAGSLVPTTLAGHRFWEESDPTRRAAQRLHFVKNASMLGGVLLAAVDTGGRPGLGWRARRAPAAVRHAASDLRRDAELALHSAKGSVHAATDTLRERIPG